MSRRNSPNFDNRVNIAIAALYNYHLFNFSITDFGNRQCSLRYTSFISALVPNFNPGSSVFVGISQSISCWFIRVYESITCCALWDLSNRATEPYLKTGISLLPGSIEVHSCSRNIGRVQIIVSIPTS